MPEASQGPQGQGWGGNASSWPPVPEQDSWQQGPPGAWEQAPGPEWQQQAPPDGGWQQQQPTQSWSQGQAWPPQGSAPQGFPQQGYPPQGPPPGGTTPPPGSPPWMSPYPTQSGGFPPPPPTRGRGTRWTIIIVVLVVILAGGGVGLVFALKGSPSHPTANPTGTTPTGTASTGTATSSSGGSSTPSPTGTQPLALKAATVFPSAQLFGNSSDNNLVLDRVTTVDTANCAELLPPQARAIFAQAGCDGVIAGTYKTADGQIEVTVALFELSSLDAAKTIALYDTTAFGTDTTNTLPGLGPSGPTSEPNGTASATAVSTRYLETSLTWLTDGQPVYSSSGTAAEDAPSIVTLNVAQNIPPNPPPSSVVGTPPATPAFNAAYVFYGTRVPGALGGFDMTRKAVSDSANCATRVTGVVLSTVRQDGCSAVTTALYETVDGHLYDSISVFALASQTDAQNVDDTTITSDGNNTLGVTNPLLAGVPAPTSVYIDANYSGRYLIVQTVWFANGASANNNVGPLINMDVALGDPVTSQLGQLAGGSG